MSIKIQSGLRRPRQLAPANYGRSKLYFPVQTELSYLVSRANAKFQESVTVDGVEVNFWRRGIEGKFCTCQSPEASPEDAKYFPHNEDQNIQQTNEDIDEKSNRDLNMQKLFKVRGAWDYRESQKHPVTEAYGYPIGEVPEIDGGEKGTDSTFKEVTNDLQRDAELAAQQMLGLDSAFIGAEGVRCGICFRTGHLQGYDLVNGRREIFDATQTFDTEIKGFIVNKQNKPFSFESGNDKSNYVAWLYEFPTYFDQCIRVAVRNNTKKVVNAIIEYKLINSSNWNELTEDWVNNTRNGVPTKAWIRVRPKENTLEGLFVFTHVEMTFKLADWPLAQVTPLSESTNYGIFDTLISTEFVFSSEFIRINKEDVLFDHKYMRLWKITDSSDFQTAARQVLGWKATARVVQNYEDISLLRLINDKYYELSFAGLTAFQGLNDIFPNKPG